MQFGINLVPKQKPDSGEQNIFQKIKWVVIVVLTVYTLLIAGLFAYNFILANQKAKLEDERSKIEASIKSLKKRESLAITLKDRLEATSKILKTNTSQAELIQKVQSLALSGITLGDMDISSKEIVFSGQAQNAKVLGDFLEQLQGRTSEWSLIELSSLSRTKDGIYDFSLKTIPFSLK